MEAATRLLDSFPRLERVHVDTLLADVRRPQALAHIETRGAQSRGLLTYAIIHFDKSRLKHIETRGSQSLGIARAAYLEERSAARASPKAV